MDTKKPTWLWAATPLQKNHRHRLKSKARSTMRPTSMTSAIKRQCARANDEAMTMSMEKGLIYKEGLTSTRESTSIFRILFFFFFEENHSQDHCFFSCFSSPPTSPHKIIPSQSDCRPDWVQLSFQARWLASRSKKVIDRCILVPLNSERQGQFFKATSGSEARELGSYGWMRKNPQRAHPPGGQRLYLLSRSSWLTRSL